MRLVLTCLVACGAALAQKPQANPDPAKRFFAKRPVVRVAITLSPQDRQALRDTPREYVPATLAIDGDKKGWPKVGVKLKGAAGSFRKVDDRPGFTINLGKFGGTERLHGLKRFHLNNGKQDDSRLCEWLGCEIFTAAGYPAPRVAHAMVTLDGEVLGLYVLREGFDRQFLQRTLGKTNGTLYDGGFCHDIDDALERDSGDGPRDGSDLDRLRDACAMMNEGRTAKLESSLNIKAFIDFMALEAMVGHWDGYCQNRNNFRLWCSAELGRSLFFPHGMDQLFGKAHASVLQHPSAIVASAVQQHPNWRKLYRARLKALLPLLKSSLLNKKLKAQGDRLERALKRHDPDQARELSRAVRKLMGKVSARYQNLGKQVRQPEPKALTFRKGKPRKLDDWNPSGETDHIELKKRGSALFIGCKSRGEQERRGAYRATVLLERGKYRVTAKVRTDDVEALATGGGGVRLMAGKRAGAAMLGDNKWTDVSCDFEVTKLQSNVDLRLELRGRNGKVWFRISSLQLAPVAR